MLLSPPLLLVRRLEFNVDLELVSAILRSRRFHFRKYRGGSVPKSLAVPAFGPRSQFQMFRLFVVNLIRLSFENPDVRGGSVVTRLILACIELILVIAVHRVLLLVDHVQTVVVQHSRVLASLRRRVLAARARIAVVIALQDLLLLMNLLAEPLVIL